jgi:hypothetical protein
LIETCEGLNLDLSVEMEDNSIGNHATGRIRHQAKPTVPGFRPKDSSTRFWVFSFFLDFCFELKSSENVVNF